jgi:hypothetical protein
MKVIIIVFVVFFQSFAQQTKLKTGDFLFQSMNCGSLCEAINEVTSGYKGLDFNHVGLVVFENDAIFVYEASGKEVKKTKLSDFKNYTTEPIYIGRLKRNYRKYIPDALVFIEKQLGTPYDDAYLYNNGSYYCSELIYDAFLFAYKKPLFELRPMTFKSPKNNTFFKVWQDYYNSLNIEIPEGQLGCNPGGFSTSNKIKIIGVL